MKTANDRFLSSFEKSTTCWNWTAYKSEYGYGQFWNGCKTVRAHRYAYELFIVPITNAMHVLHKCDNRSCVNPDHLFLGTNFDNVKDRVAKGRSGRVLGEANQNCKFSNDQIAHILKLRSAKVPYAKITQLTGASKAQISRIGNNLIRVSERAASNLSNSSKTHCKHGHEFNDLNTRLDSRGKRECRTCGRLKTAKQRRAKRIAEGTI